MYMKKFFLFIVLVVFPILASAQASGGQIRRKSTSIINSHSSNNSNKILYAKTGSHNGYDYVDLGLSVKWATYNIGATSIEAYGDLFAWGECESKSKYSEDNYACAHISSLVNHNDVATEIWGGKWRMPTYEEFRELCNKCKWRWVSFRGINGFRITGNNGNSIFLPAAGFHNSEDFISRNERGYYWTSTLEKAEQNPQPYCLQMLDSFHEVYHYMWRWMGLSVRAVCQ